LASQEIDTIVSQGIVDTAELPVRGSDPAFMKALPATTTLSSLSGASALGPRSIH
jgi:hypothetical protein